MISMGFTLVYFIPVFTVGLYRHFLCSSILDWTALWSLLSIHIYLDRYPDWLAIRNSAIYLGHRIGY